MIKDLTLLGLGAGLMYYLDPDRGRRRRALFLDQVTHGLAELEDLSGKAGRDARNRARGLAAQARTLFEHDDAPDGVIVERIRSGMGRVVSHPGAIEVVVRGGRATLRGPILADEAGPLLAMARSTRGVREVVDQLEPHREPGSVSALQGGKVVRGSGPRPTRSRDVWPPSTRMLAGATGGTLLLAGLARGGLLGVASGALGAALLGRSVGNRPLPELIGSGGGGRAFEARDTIHVDAPVGEVFAFLTNYENYPHILPNVRDVRHLGEGHWRWTLVGPGGLELEVEDVMTAFEPNAFVSWQSTGGSQLRYSGAARYVERPDGGTTVHAMITYSPPGGALGHGLAWLAGYDPRHQLQQVLQRTKAFLETGRIPHDAQDPTPPAHHRVRVGS